MFTPPKRLGTWALLILFSSGGVVNAEDSCVYTSQVPFWKPKDTESVLIAQQTAVGAQASDLTSFCKWNRMDRIVGDSSSANEYRRAKLAGNMEAAEDVLLHNRREVLGDPWATSMGGTERLKAAGKDSVFSEKFDKARLGQALDAVQSTHDNFTFPGAKAYAIPASPKDQTKACNYMQASDAETCVKAVDDLLNLVRLNAARAPTLGIKNFERIVRDPELRDGLINGSRKALSRTEQPGEPHANVYDDMKEGFRAAGASEAQAQDKAWDVMFLYAVGGPNFYLRTDATYSWSKRWKNENPNLIGTQVLVESMVKNDTQPKAGGKDIYSLPDGTKFPCDIGKSYHFWMTGYFARYLRKLGYSKEISAKVAYAAAVTYQLKPIGSGGEGGRTAREGFHDYARFGTIENGMRLDLNLAAAGAAFGASDGEKVKDISRGFKQSLLQGGLQANDSLTNDDEYTEMLARLQPYKIFDYYAK